MEEKREDRKRERREEEEETNLGHGADPSSFTPAASLLLSVFCQDSLTL